MPAAHSRPLRNSFLRWLSLGTMALLLSLSCAKASDALEREQNDDGKTDEEIAQGRLNTLILIAVVGPYTQLEIDNDTAYAIVTVMRELYNQLIVGQPGGAQNRTGNCSTSGSVNITGTASSSGGTTTLNLNYAFTNCRAIVSTSTSMFGLGRLTVDLTLNGTINESGSLTSSSTSLVLTGTNVPISGTSTNTGQVINNSVSINQTCSVTINRPGTGLNGTICGRAFAY